MNPFRSLIALLAGMLLSVPLIASAQEPPPQPLPQDQLDALLAPIALYPDELLTQVLMASTYPLASAAGLGFYGGILLGQPVGGAPKLLGLDPSELVAQQRQYQHQRQQQLLGEPPAVSRALPERHRKLDPRA